MTQALKQYKRETSTFFTFLKTPKEEHTLAQCMEMLRAVRPRSLDISARLQHVPDELHAQCEAICLLEGLL